MKMRAMTRAVAGLAVVIGMATVTATSANAVLTWTWEKAGGNNIGTATYTDSNNNIHVNDQEVDDRSVLLFVHKPGVSTGYACWDHSGAGTGGTSCNLAQYDENTLLEGYLCKGEWATNPADRVIFWGGCNTAGAKTFRK